MRDADKISPAEWHHLILRLEPIAKACDLLGWEQLAGDLRRIATDMRRIGEGRWPDHGRPGRP